MANGRPAVPQKVNRGVQPADPVGTAPRYRWDDLRLFMLAAEAGSLRAAAQSAGCSINTVRNRIEQLEHDLGFIVAKRSVDGFILTAEGQDMLSIAREMSSGASALDRLTRKRGERSARKVAVQVTEGLGTFWLMPRIVDFQAEHPDLTVELTCDMKPVDVSFRDIDIAVQLEQPRHPDLVIQRLGTLHLMPFAAPQYIRAHGTPSTIQDLFDHKLVLQKSEQVSQEGTELVLGSTLPPGTVSISANTSSAHYWAIARGAGIGLLPTYARAVNRRVVPVDIGLKLRRDIFLVYHPDAKRSRAAEQAIAWIRASFDAELYPWFADQFVHPTDLERHFHDGTVVKLFDDMQDVEIR
ncbi:LysR family transcriptional regulator [Sphingomonas naphthae]|uniref:LysR family transcriptional regulator n=1 Tax=Sphingomonas naphthae TaxID=1813468 RepID=A0ABY7TFL3_9SPHN|nr:LysR family transcriptional regulator [Sphingomonas naphthae]WCT71929.1 LysR family transcriptional regulator [Sphingomonas naphthae]